MLRVQDVDQQDLDALKGAQWLSGAKLPSRSVEMRSKRGSDQCARSRQLRRGLSSQ